MPRMKVKPLGRGNRRGETRCVIWQGVNVTWNWKCVRYKINSYNTLFLSLKKTSSD